MLVTPGPTTVPPQIHDRLSEPMPNPDIEQSFFDTYGEVCEKLRRVYDTDDGVVVMGGEGILGPEAAVASTVAPGGDVLYISNGLCGDGFADFVEGYGDEPTLVGTDYTDPFDLADVEAMLDDGEFAVATMIHRETSMGTLSDITPVPKLLSNHDALTTVGAVSSFGGAPVPSEHIDINPGTSQKAFSSPPGLATTAVSDRAWEAVGKRDPGPLYTSLLPWRGTSGGSPYTHLGASVAVLDESSSMLLEEGLDAVCERHEKAVTCCREREAGLELDVCPDTERSSPTVAVLHLPGEARRVQAELESEHGIILATGLAGLADDIPRVSHMGYSADVGKVDRMMDALEEISPMK